MHSALSRTDMLAPLLLTNLFLIASAVTYSDRDDYDAFGIRVASTDYFVVLAQNDASSYSISMHPFGTEYICTYAYSTFNEFVISIAAGRRQNSSQLSFVYLRTNSTDGHYKQLGLYKFSLVNESDSTENSCSDRLGPQDGEHEAIVWTDESSELTTLQVDPYGKYAYGFLSETIFIYDIEKNNVQNLSWNDIFPSMDIEPHALDVSETDDGFSMAILAGYSYIERERALPTIYLIRLEPPSNMTLVANYTLRSDKQQFIRGRYVSTYQFAYVMSVSIHDSVQKVLIGVPQSEMTLLFSFNSTNFNLIREFEYPARSIRWLDDHGTQAGLLLSSVSTLPWASSRIQVINTSSSETLYAYPNNQQILKPWSNTPPIFIRLTTTYDYQLVILTSDGIVVLVPSSQPGFYTTTEEINAPLPMQIPCPSGTYKSTRGTTPCTICPTGRKSVSTSKKYSVLVFTYSHAHFSLISYRYIIEFTE